MKTRRLGIFIGFEKLSSSVGRQVMTGQNQSHNCGFAVVKVF